MLEINQLPVRHLSQLIDSLGFHRVSRELNVHRTTIQRWQRSEVKIPGHQHQVIKMLLGDLPGTCGQWTGWRFRDGKLVSPEGTEFSQGEVRAIPLRLQLINQLDRELTRLKILRQVNDLDPQGLGDQVVVSLGAAEGHGVGGRHGE